MQALPALPESLAIIEMGTQESTEMEMRSQGALYLNIGLQVGNLTSFGKVDIIDNYNRLLLLL